MDARSGNTWATYALVVAWATPESVVAILVPPYLRSQGFDFSTIGLLVALLGILSLVSRIPGGMIYRPERGRAIMLVALAVFGVTNALYPFVSGPLAFGLVRSINGLALGVLTTANMAMFMDRLSPSGNKARALGLYAGAMSAGYTLGSLLGGVAGDALGYSPSFVLAGVLTLAALALQLVETPLPPRKVVARSDPAMPAISGAPRPGALTMLSGLADPRLASLSLTALILNFLHQVQSSFFPLYGVAIGLSLTDIGVIRSTYALANTISRPLASPPINRFGHQRASFVGAVLITLLLILIPFVPPFLPLLALLAVIGTLRGVSLVANTVGMADIDERRMSRGMVSGLYNACKDSGNLASPVVAGVISSAIGLSAMFVAVPLGASMLFFAAVAGLHLRARQQTGVVREQPG